MNGPIDALDVMAVLGLLLIAIGLGMVWLPLAAIAAGIALLAASVFVANTRRTRQ